MNSFNVYGQTETKIGGHTPVWLGTVKPIPRGYTFDYPLQPGQLIPAGTPVAFVNGIAGQQISPVAASGAQAYTYNDVYNDSKEETLAATVAVVMYHSEGLLIDRCTYMNYSDEDIQTLQERIPGVLLVRG